MIHMTLPWPPSVNSYWRHPTKGPLAGRHLISEDGRAYRSGVALQIAAAHVVKSPLTSRLAIKICAAPPDRRARDLDNILKSLLDALTYGKLIRDDSQFDEIHIIRMPPSKPGTVTIFINPLENT